MTRGRLFVVGGGARSGKSAYAEQLAQSLGSRRHYIATGVALDDEMQARIARHRADRGDAFTTIEAPYALAEALSDVPESDVVLVDCLTTWTGNLMFRGDDDEAIYRALEEALAAHRRRSFDLVLVTNEVGLGIVPENALARRFRDVAGRCHQRLAAHADELLFAAMGCVMRLRPGPVETVWPPLSDTRASQPHSGAPSRGTI